MSECKDIAANKRILDARPGDYKSFVAEMKQATLDYQHPDGKFKGQNPLKGVDLSDHGNFLNGLYHSWAAVLEVLSFYQDKIAQEGYLNTATESFSVEQLVAAIGYRRPHALSAKTWLAFTLSNDSQRQQYVIPKGTRAQNIPQGGKPVLFETIESVIGRPDWNTLSPKPEMQASLSHSLVSSASFCHVNKPTLPIKKQTHLWVTGEVTGEPVNYFVSIRDVMTLQDGSLLLFWHQPLAMNDTGNIQHPRLYWMPKEYSIWGHDVLPWNALTLAEKANQAEHFSSIIRLDNGALLKSDAAECWQALAYYPDMSVYAMVGTASGKIVAAGMKGMFYSVDSGGTWRQVRDKLANRAIFCLLVHDDVIYAGGSQGQIICSYDEGQTWTPIRGSRPLDKEAKKHIIPGLLPPVTINSLTAITLQYRDGGVRHILFMGTVKGLFYSTDLGQYWLAGEGLFRYHNEVMPEGVRVYHLQSDGERVVASTSHGLYFANVDRHSLDEKKGEEIKNKGPSFLAKHFLFDSHEEKQWAKHNVQTAIYASIMVKTDKGLFTVFATLDEVYLLSEHDLVVCSQGVFRHADSTISAVNAFLYTQNHLLMATADGLYVSDELGGKWQLVSQTRLYTVPDPQVWEQALNNGKLPEDSAENLLFFGYPLSSDAQVGANKGADKEASDWYIEAPNSAAIHIESKANGLSLSVVACDTSSSDSQVSTLPSPDEQDKQETIFGVIQPIQNYIDALLNEAILPSLWHGLFVHIGFEISEQSIVIGEDSQQGWLILDDTQQTRFLVERVAEKLVISRLGSALSLLSTSYGAILCGGQPFSAIASRWPHFWLDDNRLPLDTKKTGITAGDTLLLNQVSPRAIQQHVNVVNVIDEPITALGKTATVTQVRVLAPTSSSTSVLLPFDRRTTSIFAGNMAFELANEAPKLHEPQREGFFRLDRKVSAIPIGHKVAVIGQQAILQLTKMPVANMKTPWTLKGQAQDGSEVSLQRQKIFSFVLQSTMLLEALVWNLDHNVLTAELVKPFLSHQLMLDSSAQLYAVGEQYWLMTQARGVYYYLALDRDANKVNVFREYAFSLIEITEQSWMVHYHKQVLRLMKDSSIETRWLAADSAANTSTQVSELVEVSECHNVHHQYTHIQFASTLTHYYDPATLRFFANIAPAVHGETVTKELIASTEQGKPFQRFELHRSPLTVYQDEDGQLKNFLSLNVHLSGARNGRMPLSEKWQQTAAILKSAAHQRDYEIYFNGKGKTEILFGDGVHGRIPQAGGENVFASYRVGGGALGNLPAGAIKLLRTKPLGVKSVFNPVPAQGGADPVVFGTLRENAPQSLDYLDLIISSDDCLKYARQFAGVTQASLTRLQCQHQPIWVVCIDASCLSLADKAQLASELALAIKAILSHPVDVRVVLARWRYFHVSAKVWGKNLATTPDLIDDLKQSVSNHYFNLSNSLGKDVDIAHITAVLQKQAGVAGVEVTQLNFYIQGADIQESDVQDVQAQETDIQDVDVHGVQAQDASIGSLSLLPASPVMLDEKKALLGAERLLTNESLVSITLGDGA